MKKAKKIPPAGEKLLAELKVELQKVCDLRKQKFPDNRNSLQQFMRTVESKEIDAIKAKLRIILRKTLNIYAIDDMHISAQIIPPDATFKRGAQAEDRDKFPKVGRLSIADDQEHILSGHMNKLLGEALDLMNKRFDGSRNAFVSAVLRNVSVMVQLGMHPVEYFVQFNKYESLDECRKKLEAERKQNPAPPATTTPKKTTKKTDDKTTK